MTAESVLGSTFCKLAALKLASLSLEDLLLSSSENSALLWNGVSLVKVRSNFLKLWIQK